MSEKETLKRLLDEVQSVKDENDNLKREFKSLKRSENGGGPSPASGRNLFDVPSDTDVLSLNVGGKTMDVMRGTLTSVPGVMSKMFSGTHDKSLPRDSNGRFFLDESPILFTELIEYLRDLNRALPRDAEVRPSPPTFHDAEKQKRFLRMVDSLDMSSYFYPLQLHRYDPGDEKIHLVSKSFDTEVDHAGDDFRYDLRIVYLC